MMNEYLTCWWDDGGNNAMIFRINKTIFDGIYGDFIFKSYVKPKTCWTKTTRKIEILESEVLWWRLAERRKFHIRGFNDSLSVEIITYICLIKVLWSKFSRSLWESACGKPTPRLAWLLLIHLCIFIKNY